MEFHVGGFGDSPEDCGFSESEISQMFFNYSVAKRQKPEKPILHIYGLGASVGCECISEHSTRRDENHKYAVWISLVSSVLPTKSQNFLEKVLAF